MLREAIPLLQRLSATQKACLSYWIFEHNRRYRLREEQPDPVGTPVLDRSWIETHQDRNPPTEDRLLSFLRELTRQHDVGQSPDWDLLLAASGCPSD